MPLRPNFRHTARTVLLYVKPQKATGAGGNTGAENKNSYDLDAEGILISRRCRQQLGLSFWLVKFGELLFLT